jgi:hypothetical protein
MATTATVGEYDIILDVNQNGICNAGDAVDHPNHPGSPSLHQWMTDGDGDTFMLRLAPALDCDDFDPEVNPDATEICMTYRHDHGI